jgi:hypothetical protein
MEQSPEKSPGLGFAVAGMTATLIANALLKEVTPLWLQVLTTCGVVSALAWKYRRRLVRWPPDVMSSAPGERQGNGTLPKSN